jgi:hypothetical protein
MAVYYLQVVDNNLSETVGEHVFGELGRSITNFGHQELALELPADSVVNTLRSAPVSLQKRSRHLIIIETEVCVVSILAPSACGNDRSDDE